MEKKLIKSVSSYEKNGEKKSTWRTVGELFESNGKTYMKLYINPETLYHVFDADREEDKGNQPF